MTCGCEIWISTTKLHQKLVATQRAMERSVLNASKRVKKTNEWIRQQTKMTDFINQTTRLKWKWTDHVAIQKDDI